MRSWRRWTAPAAEPGLTHGTTSLAEDIAAWKAESMDLWMRYAELQDRSDERWMGHAVIQDSGPVYDPRRLVWKATITYDGGKMRVEIEADPSKPVCGEKNPECYWECRLWPNHDGPHMPFTKELLHTQPDLVVTSMRSA